MTPPVVSSASTGSTVALTRNQASTDLFDDVAGPTFVFMLKERVLPWMQNWLKSPIGLRK